MALTSLSINNFNSGELSPRLEGRADLSRYLTGCKKLENFIILPQGGVTRRPGTKFINEVKHSSKLTCLVPFQFSTTQAYILEFGDLYIRIYKDGGRIADVEKVTTYTENELPDLKFTQSADVLYIVHPSHAPAKLSRTSHTAWDLADVDWKDGPYGEEIEGISLTPSGFGGAITLTASAAIFVATDVGRLLRFKAVRPANWDSTTAYAVGNYCFFDRNYTCLVAHTNKQPPNDSYWKENGNDGWYWMIITVFTSSTVVTAEVKGDNLPNLSASPYFRMGIWNSLDGWPSCATFFDGRLMLSKVHRIQGSHAGDFENMAPGSLDSDAIDYSLASGKVDAIEWMISQEYLVVGTADGIWRVGGASSEDPITPTSIVAKRQSTIGSSGIVGLMVEDEVIYVQRGGKKVRYISYSMEKGVFVAEDVTILAEHITGNGLVDITYVQDPESVVWVVRGDGQLAGFIFERHQQVMGWSRHIIGGSFQNGNAIVESVASIPGDTEDEVWLIVKRTINGATKRYIERMSTRHFGNKEDAFFVDSGLTWDGGAAIAITGASKANPVVITADTTDLTDGDQVYITGVVGMTQLNGNVYTVASKGATTFALSGVDGTGYTTYVSGGTYQRVENTFAGLGHLEGETVAICGDGAYLGTKKVSGGAISALSDYYNKVHIGLPFTSIVSPMPIEIPSSQDRVKRIHKVFVRFLDTIGGKIGSDEDSLESISFGTDLFTGDKDLEFTADYSTYTTVVIAQDEPLPMTILSVTSKLGAYGV